MAGGSDNFGGPGFGSMDRMGADAHDAIERHVEERFGAIEFVFHAVPSTGVHVLVVGPTEDRRTGSARSRS